MLDHFTYHVPAGTLDGDAIATFMAKIGFREVPAKDKYEHGWKVRWFEPVHSGMSPVRAHFVETDDGEQDRLALGHFCVKLPKQRIVALSEERECVRDSGSGRIWLEFANLRVEVRP